MTVENRRYLSTPSSAADDRKFVKSIVVKGKENIEKCATSAAFVEGNIRSIKESLQTSKDSSQYQPCGKSDLEEPRMLARIERNYQNRKDPHFNPVGYPGFGASFQPQGSRTTSKERSHWPWRSP